MKFSKSNNWKSHEKIHIDKKQNFVTNEDHANSKAIQPEQLKHEVSANKVPNIAFDVSKTNENTTNVPQNSAITIVPDIQMQSEEKENINQPPTSNIFSLIEDALTGSKDLEKLKSNDEIVSNGNPTHYSCRFCLKAFKRLDAKNIHERIHTGEKPYSCKVCNKCFSDPAILARHKNIHTDVKPFPCIFCTFKFREKRTCTRHENVHRSKGHEMISDKSKRIHFLHRVLNFQPG